jgi:hypothetical protein
MDKLRGYAKQFADSIFLFFELEPSTIPVQTQIQPWEHYQEEINEQIY